MNNRYGRSRRKIRVTFRFYAIMTVLFVLIVMLCVYLGTRGRTVDSNPPVYDPTAQTAYAPDQGTVQYADPIVAQDPVAETPVDTQQTTEQQQFLEPEAQEPQLGEGIDTEIPNQQNSDLIQMAGARTDLSPDWVNILLLASDTRDPNKLSQSLTDSIMVVSVNKVTGQIKMMSILRDTMIECPGVGMMKINAVAQHGGIVNIINVINSNLGLNITDYALVDFGGMARIVDILDGIKVNITEAERDLINDNMGQIAVYTMEQQDYLSKREEMKLKVYGENVRLNGIQAVTYARIRYIDTDERRAERQQNVLKAMMDEVKDISVLQIAQIANAVLQNLKTNVSALSGINYVKAAIGCQLPSKDRLKSWKIPGSETAKYETRAGTEAFYDVNYEELKIRVHRWIYET